MSDELLINRTLRSGSAMVASLLFACALIGAIFLSVWYIDNASVDVPYSDTWGYFRMVEHFLAGHLTLDDIFHPHNQNRPVLFNVVLLLSAKYSYLDLKTIEYVSVIFIITTISFLLYFSRRLFEGRWTTFFLVFSCISMLLFSLAQWENLLLPINFVFFSTIAFSVGSILLMNHHLRRPVSHVLSADLAAATLLSELALFSMGGGVLIWVVNLVQIMLSRALHRRRVGLVLLVYGGVGLISLAIYLHDLGASVNLDFILSHPAEFLQFVLIGLGNSVVGYFNNAPLLPAALATGFVLLSVYCVVSVAYFRLPASDQKQTLGIFCLLLLGVSEELLIGLGRLSLGVVGAAAPRYSTLTMISVAASLILLAFYANRSRAYATMAVLLGVGICVCSILADYNEILMAGSRRQYGENLQRILRHGQVGADDMRQLEWRSLSDIQFGNRMLRQFHLSLYHDDGTTD